MECSRAHSNFAFAVTITGRPPVHRSLKVSTDTSQADLLLEFPGKTAIEEPHLISCLIAPNPLQRLRQRG
jgi:hypothetical protein